MILPAGTIKRIHVNQHIIRSNAANGVQEPVFTVKHKGRTHLAHLVQIIGSSSFVYSPDKPLSCGAKVWVETKNAVDLE